MQNTTIVLNNWTNHEPVILGATREQDNLSYKNEQKGIQAPTKHKTKETGFAVLTNVKWRDPVNKMRKQLTSFSS